MTEEEKLFNRMLELFKENAKFKGSLKVTECDHLVNVTMEKVSTNKEICYEF